VKVVYGHTDSIYVTMPSIEYGKEVCQEINNHVQKFFPNVLGLDEHPVQLEFEKYYHSLGVGTTKNRNAGLVIWKDGIKLKEPEFIMTGFTAKRVSETQVAKSVQITALKMWVKENTQGEITDYARGIFNKVKLGNIPLQDIIKRRRYKEERFTVKCPSCKKKYSLQECRAGHCECGDETRNFTTLEGKRPMIGEGVAGIIWWSQTAMGRQNPISDSYLFIKVNNPSEVWEHPLTGAIKPVEWIAAPTTAVIENLITAGFMPNYNYYSNVVIKKIKPIYDAMCWQTDGVTLDERQQTLDAWF